MFVGTKSQRKSKMILIFVVGEPQIFLEIATFSNFFVKFLLFP